MKKKICNDVLLVVYPLILMLGSWYYQWLQIETRRTFEIPLFQTVILALIYFLLLGLFAYFFLVQNKECHILFLAVGILELMALLSGGEILLYGSVLTLYVCLAIKTIRIRCKNSST